MACSRCWNSCPAASVYAVKPPTIVVSSEIAPIFHDYLSCRSGDLTPLKPPSSSPLPLRRLRRQFNNGSGPLPSVSRHKYEFDFRDSLGTFLDYPRDGTIARSRKCNPHPTWSAGRRRSNIRVRRNKTVFKEVGIFGCAFDLLEQATDSHVSIEIDVSIALRRVPSHLRSNGGRNFDAEKAHVKVHVRGYREPFFQERQRRVSVQLFGQTSLSARLLGLLFRRACFCTVFCFSALSTANLQTAKA